MIGRIILAAIAVCTLSGTTAAYPQGAPPEVGKDRTDALRSLGIPDPEAERVEKERRRVAAERKRHWKDKYESDWKAFRKEQSLKYKRWEKASETDREAFQSSRKQRDLPPVPESFLSQKKTAPLL